MATDGEVFGHKQMTVLEQIQSILEKYPFGDQILKEVIQNADDAGAEQVDFMLDLDSHSQEGAGLVDPSLAKYQGPALYSWNSASFSERDWKGIEETGRSSKKEDYLKVGRFGLGFISMYHITDCPWIISKQNICYLDPQNENPDKSGRRYPLSSFFANPKYSGHHSCFSRHYFGFNGGSEFSGTIFRFPLRTGSYSSSISNEIHGVDEIRSVLFDPLIREGEHIIPFLKYVNQIRILEKVNNKVSVVHSVAVADRFKQSLYAHRKEITIFAENKCYHEKTGLFITLYPIDTNGSEAIWLVMNLLGFGERSPESSDNEFYRFYCKNTLKYIPWFGIGMPTGAKSCHSIENNHTWKFDWNGCSFDSILEFIQSNVRFSLPLSSDSILDTNDGKYYCFLPIPKESLFPFHIHAYFALDDNRKSPKWPSSYDRSPDSKWNKFQSEMLGTVLYASFLHLSILNFSHPQPENYHYKLFGDFNIHEMDDSLFSIIQREGLRLLLDRKLVFSQSLHWIPLDKALYAPSTIPELTESVWSSDTERCCINLLLRLSEPIVELPSNVIALIAKYQFLKESIRPQILSPKRMRNILRLNSFNKLCLEFLATKQNAIQLLDIVLWDLEPSSDDIHLEEALEGIPLLLTADKSSKPRTFSAEASEIYYISEITSKYLSIFPGLESRFVDPALPQNIHGKLVNISRVIAINIRDITHIEPETFSCLLTLFFNTTFHSVTPPLTWTPGCNNQPRANWIKSLWEFIGTSTTLLSAVEHFPILPKGLLSTQSIQLLSAQSNEVPYVEFDATRGTTEIENILSEAGCELCHRHFFIQRFEDFVLRPVPQCLISVFRNEHILTQFISLISKTNNSTHRQLIEFFNSIPLDKKEARDIVKRVPIFLNFKGHWLTLSTQIGQRFPVLAPKTIPDNIDYPPYILTPFDSPLVVLYQKLNISNNNENEFIQLDLVPYMISSELFQFPLTRNLLAVWVLDRLPTLQLATGDELLEFLRDTKWLVDSSTPSDKSGQVKLFKPSGMLNPIDPLLKQLIDRSNEGFFPNGLYDDHVEKMKKYFEFKSNNNLNSRLRKEVSKAAINNLREQKCYVDWLTMFRALLELISLYFDKCELRDQESLWKEFNKKFVLPQLDIPSLMPFKLPFDGTLCFPSQVIACTLEQVPLIAFVRRFIVIPEMSSPENGDTHTGILSCMTFETQIPCSYVVEQLNYIINSFHNEKCDFSNLHKVMSTIYQNLNLHTTSPSMQNLKSRFIFSEERREFIEIANITETTEFDMRPYLYSYVNLGYNCLQLFKSLGMSTSPTADQYSSVLNTIYIQSNGNPISPQQLGIIMKILEVSYLDPNVYTIYVPGHDNVMYPTSDDRLVFSDDKWLNRAQICSEFPFVFAHERISRKTAINLGITSFYERVATGAHYGTLDKDQSVIQEIKCLLESYSDELALVREMVQNSDDSGASQLKILFDYRRHPSFDNPDTSSLLSRGMHHWQGPAIWFYNDKVMQESDCHNILCVGGRGKANDVTKIGRDGIGFCSAFYLTDLPSFVSGDTLHILDPHMGYTEQKYFQSNVCKIDFCSKKFVKFYRDQFAPYQDLFGCNILNNEFYKSTLFRIPLRSVGIKSQLSVKSYDKNMEYLQKLIIKYVENILLFTENLTRIEISELRGNTFTNAGAHIKPIYWQKREPENFQSLLKTQKTTLERCLQGEPIDSIEHSFECSISSSTTHSPKYWLLCYTSGGGDELANIVNSMKNENYRIHAPITAVAFDLTRLTERNLVFETKLFCLHPLSVSLQLPYHCNGMFELDSGKMALFNEAMEPQKTEWNTFLISNALTNAVLNLYTCLAEKAKPDLYCHFLYNIFTKKMISHPVWKTFCVQITQKLMQSKARLFPVTSAQGNSWSSFSEVAVLNELELKDKIVDAYFNQSFLDSIKQFLFNLKGLKIATVPAELHQSSGLLDFLLTHTNNDSIIGINRIVELFFESLHEMSEGLMMGLLPALIASHSSIPILFNLISNVPCIPCGDSYQLRVPSDVIDPNNSILSDLYYPEENRLPSSRAPLFTTDSPCYQILKKEFGLLSKQLTLSCLQERVAKIVAGRDTHLAGKILIYLNQDIFSNYDAEQMYDILSNQRFIPTLQGYPLSIQSEDCLAAPKQVVVYSLRHFLGLQRTVLTYDVSCLSHAIKLLKIQPNCTGQIPTDMLLNEIVVCRESYEELSLHSELLLEKMTCLFGELAERMEKDRTFIIANLDKKCIYIPEVGFVAPERVIFEHERSFSPYIHSIKHLYRLEKKLFLSIGVGQTLTLIQCLDVLEELWKADVELNPTDEALAITLIDEMANRLYEEIGKSSSSITIFLIGEDKYIHKSTESILFDLTWKNKGGYKGDIKINNKSYYFVHPQISNSTADKLGAISLSSSIITIASRKLKFDYQIKSQQERLTNRLKDIVDRYEAPVEVFKELLQNADDAKAKTVKFLFDMSSYGNTSLIRSEMEVCQGPSLYVYNDKTFSTNDFENIMDIGGETKKTDTTKIGRFGLGFNTVYHLTDIPSFVSGRFIHILDPHLFCGESGLEINFTENEAILKECYFDQFEVYNDIFDCNVFSEIPYDGTLFRFPFRTPRTASMIKPTGLFHKKGDIKKLQQSFLDIIEQVIFFLQYVQTIEVYERREKGGKKQLICKVDKTFKTRPYQTSFLNHYEDHFNSIVKCEREDHVSAIEVIEICRDKSSCEEYILSYASGTEECVDVINKFEELKQASVLPVAAVGIPRQLLSPENSKAKHKCEEDYKLFCFLPIPKKSPYRMHINGYFHLSSYRTELHITEENAHLTQWNCSLINDALPNALISLLMHIREELFLQATSSAQLEKYYSYFPLSDIKEKPWDTYTSKTIQKIIDCDLPLFPCALHPENWISFSEVSFLTCTNLNLEFIMFLKKLAVEMGIFFVDITNSIKHTQFFTNLFRVSSKSYDFKRICEELLFPNIEVIMESSLKDLLFVISNLLDLYSKQEYYLHYMSPLRNLAFIPCGDSDPVLRIPSEVVHPDSKFSSIYYPEERRLPHTDFHKLFKKETYVLQQLGIILDGLSEKELIERCSLAQSIYSDDTDQGHKHSMILLNYINTCRAIPNSLSSIDFLPVWEDPLFIHLDCRETGYLIPPEECYSYSCRYLLTPRYYALSEDVSKLGKALELLNIQSIVRDQNIIVDLLEIFCSKEDSLREYEDDYLDERIKQIYSWLAWFCFPAGDSDDSEGMKKKQSRKQLKENLKNKAWIWHPAYKQFYEISQVKIASEFLNFKSKFLITFPYPELLASNYNKVRQFFEFMGLKPNVEHSEAIEILSKMRQEYDGNILEECDFELAKRLILEEVGKYYDKNRDNTPPEETSLLSENNCLHLAKDLFRNDIDWMENTFTDTDKEFIVNKYIPAFMAHILGAKSMRSTYFEEEPMSIEGIQMEKFGPSEAISDRIENIKSQVTCDVTILNELLQNAEDAGATEIAFILDKQEYPTDYLCFAADTHKEWQKLQSTPSLLVYNNQAFTENDLVGIQKVGIGGKRSRQTIGRFGIGFNAVYHLTRSPCLLTSPGGDTTTFCIFDPYREYLNISDKSELPGKKIKMRNDCKQVFKDQLRPYEVLAITENDNFPDMLTNLKFGGCYSLFRFPLTATKHDIKKKINGILDQLLIHSSRLLLFLKNIKRIDIMCIDENGEVQPKGMLISNTILHPDISPDLPEFYSDQYLKSVVVTVKEIKTETWTAVSVKSQASNEVRIPETSNPPSTKFKSKKESTKWLCYNHEESIDFFPDHEKFRDKIEAEKLSQIFGNIALNLTNISKKKQVWSYIFCFLPIGTSFNFPIHINAPLIVDPHRRFLKFSEKGQEGGEEQWEYTWHKSVIHHVLVPLYAKLLLDLRDLHFICTDIDSEAEYYKWYYSVFPNISISKANNAPFLELISRELYALLHETNQQVLISDDMEKLYSINQGVFKVKTDKELGALYSALNNIQYPLTNAPHRILEQVKFLNLEYQTLDPDHLANFLINDKELLFGDAGFPCELKDSVLSFREVLILLEFVLKASSDQLNALTEIPLKIDSQEILCSFSKDTEDSSLTFLSDYASLLPHCASNFIHLDFAKELNNRLTQLGFISDLSPEFLANNILIDEAFSEPCYLLFWRFAIKVCKSIGKVVQLFGAHALVPVYHRGENPNDTSLYNYPINQLDYIVSEDLVGSKATLCTALRKLDCPFLDLKDFKEEVICPDKVLLSFMKNQLISDSDQVSLTQLIGCLFLGAFLAAELGPEEALLLRKSMSGMQDVQIKLSAKILFKLRIFLTHNKTLKSISEFTVCFVNESNFKIEQSLTQELEAQGIGIFSAKTEDENPINLIKCVAFEMKIQLIDTEKFVSDYILPCFPDLPLEEQISYLRAISKLEGPVEENLYTILSSIPFIKKHNSDEQVTTDQLYLRTVPLFILCLKDELLPKAWDNETLINILTKLGLKTCVTLPILKHCACIIADYNYDDDEINKFLSILVNFLREMRLLTQTDVALLGTISEIKCVPIKKISKIDGQELTYDRELGSLQTALPHSNLGICGTMCYILPELVSDIPQEYWPYLNIQTNPPCSVVIEHLRTISEQCQEQSPEDNVIHERLFHETYSYLQNKPDFNSQELEFDCITSNGIIFSKMKLVFELEKEISPYLFKVPSSLSKFRNFLTILGVEQTATFTHYISVLRFIYLESIPTDHRLDNERMSECAKIAFSTLVTMLRSLPSDADIDLDPSDTHVLTDDDRIMPCDIVYYAENTSLLAKVKRNTRIEINILKTLPPDENGSGVPPTHLKIQNLKQVLIPSLSTSISTYTIPNHQLTTIYSQIFVSQHFHRSLMRLYYHETNKNIIHLKLRDGQIFYSEDQNDFPVNEGYKPVLDLVRELAVISVSQIDLDITDNRTNEVFTISNALSCYKDLNTNEFYINSSSDKRSTLPTFVAIELNSFLAKIFSKTLNALEFCFKIALDTVMSVFHDLEIQNCPFLDEIPLPQTPSVPVPPVVPAATPATSVVPIAAPPFIPSLPSGPVTLVTLTSHRTHARIVRADNPRPGVGAERPDPLAAKLWIRTAQCDWRTASKLSKKSTEESTLFPPQSCFLCFEATLKALTAVLYLYGGSCSDALSDRNLSLLLGEVARYTTQAVAARLEELVIPLMNYDEPTRFPCMTPGIGFYTPREFYTLETARGAIKSVRQILQKLKEATRHNEPNLESLMIEEGESGFIEMSCLSINEMFNFPMDCDLGTLNLRTDSDEFFTVARSFFATLPQVKIISIEKIINRECWKDFKRNVELQVSKYGDSCLMIKPLFHGTRTTHPKSIYEHRVGFSMEYSNGGMWGKGLYFAVNSSYSDALAHSLGNGEYCMFLAQVFVGYSEVRKSDGSIVGPTGKFHSIQGCTGGSQVHILYQNGLAYPSYLITYSR